MHSYVDEHVPVTGKRFWERLKTRFQSYILQSSFTVDSLHHNYHLNSLLAMFRTGGGELPFDRGGDARCLALGCKFQILVSLMVFWAKHHYI